jgi:hypothetical protein
LFPSVAEKAQLARNDTVNTESYDGGSIAATAPFSRRNVTR